MAPGEANLRGRTKQSPCLALHGRVPSLPTLKGLPVPVVSLGKAAFLKTGPPWGSTAAFSGGDHANAHSCEQVDSCLKCEIIPCLGTSATRPAGPPAPGCLYSRGWWPSRLKNPKEIRSSTKRSLFSGQQRFSDAQLYVPKDGGLGVRGCSRCWCSGRRIHGHPAGERGIGMRIISALAPNTAVKWVLLIPWHHQYSATFSF